MLEIYLKLSEQIVVDVLMNQAATGEVMQIGIQGCPRGAGNISIFFVAFKTRNFALQRRE